jgi:hypothetical protein
MTVSELIEQLKNYPGDTRVLTLGYEGGFNDVVMDIDDIVLNARDDKCPWYYGPHESPNFVEGLGEKCVIIRRGK